MIQIDRESAIAVIEINGIPTKTNIQETIEELLNHLDHVDGMDEIWDFRNALLADVTAEHIQSCIPTIARHLDRLGKRAALVAGSELGFGLGIMWEVYAEDKAPRERCIFRDMESALGWLK